MDFRFYKAQPEGQVNVQWPAYAPDVDPPFVVVALHRDADPDAHVHDGHDYIGAYGTGKDIDAWAGSQPLTAIAKADLPDPVSFYPAPFPAA